MTEKRYTHSELLNNLTLAVQMFLSHEIGYNQLKQVYNWTNAQMENLK